MIPAEKHEAVAQGLRQAFGVSSFDEIRQITGGRSPGILVFRILVRGRAFLLRIILRTDNPTRHFSCMEAAAEAGLAPRVWYTSVADRISITDFVETVPFPRNEGVLRMPATLRALHALPRFPRVPDAINTSCMFLLTGETAVAGLFSKVRSASVFSDGEADELFERYRQLASVYRMRDADLVSSHNDLFKPDNILFDGSRVWLVDWEAAFSNDRYADLAVVANMIVTGDAEEREFLREYFGQAPEASQHARLFLVQQFAHVFYALAFVFGASLSGPVERGEEPPDWMVLQRRFWQGEIRLEDNASKVGYAVSHLKQLLRNVRTPRFQESIGLTTRDR